MNALLHWLEHDVGVSPAAQRQLLASVATIAVLVALRWIAWSIVRRRMKDLRDRYRWRRGLTYATTGLGILLVGRIWFEGFRAVATFLGLVSAGLAIALRDPVSNLAGWVFILWRRPFQIGDRIQVGASAGDVIDVRLFQFTLLEIGNWVQADQSTGRVLFVPNSRVLTDVIANYTEGLRYIWDEIPVLVTFQSDWRKAKALLGQIVARHAEQVAEDTQRQVRDASGQFLILYTKLTPIVYTSVRDSGVLLTMRYLCEPRRRRQTAEAIWEDVLTEFQRAGDIELAYPTSRLYSTAIGAEPHEDGS